MMDNQYFEQPKINRFSKSEVYNAIQCNCYNQTGITVSTMVKIDEFPDTLRHSCFNTGVTFLQQYIWQVPSEFGYIDVPYYFCPQCGKLFVYNHIYD